MSVEFSPLHFYSKQNLTAKMLTYFLVSAPESSYPASVQRDNTGSHLFSPTNVQLLFFSAEEEIILPFLKAVPDNMWFL